MQATPARGEPDKLAIEARKTSFDEIYLPFRADQAQREASRCLKCGEHSVCEWTCPLHNHIPQWIELVKAGNIDAAVELSHQTNTLPEMTGRVCPQDRLCEGACTIRDEHGAVTIGNIERYISDQALAKGWRPDLSHVTKVDKRVAIIGAGPAGAGLCGCSDPQWRGGDRVRSPPRNRRFADVSAFLLSNWINPCWRAVRKSSARWVFISNSTVKWVKMSLWIRFWNNTMPSSLA